MLHSRATAALERLKEMDRKYKIKLKEGKSNRNNVSTESSLENTPKSNSSRVEYIQTSKKEIASKVSPKFKMKTEIVSPYANGRKSSEDEEVYLKNSSKTSPRGKIELSAETEASRESASRTEESVKTASNPESATRDSLKSSSEIWDVISGSEDPRGQDEESSVATIFARHSTAPETISEAIKPRSGKNVMEKVTAEDNLEAFNPGNDETTIDEVIRISDEKSETISELPNALDKDNIEGEDSSSASFTDEQKPQYENTFEEATNSTTSYSSTEVRTHKSSVELLPQDTVISGVKQIKITSHKREIIEEKVIDEEKDKEIVELIAPKIIKSNSVCDIDLDEELSNYVKTTENVDEVSPINLLRLSKQTTPTKKHVRKCKKHRKSSNENIKEKTDSFISNDQRLTESKVNNDGLALKKNSSSTTMKSALSARKIPKEPPKAEMASLSSEQAQVESVEVEKEAAKSETEKLMREPETISSEKLLRETPKKSDVTSTLRELNKDAINAIVRKHRIHGTSKISDKSRRCKNCQAVVKLPYVEYEEFENIEDESISTSQENIRTHSSHHQRMKIKRGKSKRISKASKARRVYNQEKTEEIQPRFYCRQTRHLQKQAATLRMQQEREDIRNYLLELQCTQLEFGPGGTGASSKIPTFKPLEFPKILGYKKPDFERSNLESTDAIAMLQEKVFTIRQWLKDQYLLYRDYSKLAQTVNAKYVPASLEDAKKTIRQLQRATI